MNKTSRFEPLKDEEKEKAAADPRLSRGRSDPRRSVETSKPPTGKKTDDMMAF